jgi:hypothetical protein
MGRHHNVDMTVTNITDAHIIALAVRDYCTRWEGHWNKMVLDAEARHDAEMAKEYRERRDQVRECSNRTLPRLNRIIERFEERARLEATTPPVTMRSGE